MEEQKVENLSGLLGCKVGTLPFTSLGLPMGTTRPRVVDFAPLVDRIERRLTASSVFLPYGGRLTLINSVLSSIPTYYMCTLQLPKTVILAIDSVRRHCLWRGSDLTQKRKPLVAWDRVCMLKKKGGSGVMNLHIQYVALLLKHLHKFYASEDIPWVNLIWDSYYKSKVPYVAANRGYFQWKDIISLIDIYRAVAQCSIVNGNTVTFWEDMWNGKVRCQHF